jgi:hypothetical protein
MQYNDNYQRDDRDPSTVAPKALDDRNRSNRNIDEEDAFNSPEDRVAHL